MPPWDGVGIASVRSKEMFTGSRKSSVSSSPQIFLTGYGNAVLR